MISERDYFDSEELFQEIGAELHRTHDEGDGLTVLRLCALAKVRSYEASVLNPQCQPEWLKKQLAAGNEKIARHLAHSGKKNASTPAERRVQMP